jgi:hypothetical protein
MIIEESPKIEELSLLLVADIPEGNAFVFQTCEEICELLRAMPTLKKFRIEGAAGLPAAASSDSGLSLFRDFGHRLESISLSSMLRVDPSFRPADFEWMSGCNITRLHLVYSTERQRFYKEREPRNLSCWWDSYDSRCLRVNSWIDDQGVAALTEFIPHIEDLALHPAPQLVGGKSLWRAIGERCPKLRSLSLGYLSSFLPQSVRDLASTPQLVSHLRCLRLHHPPQLDLQDVAYIATSEMAASLDALEISEGGVETRSMAWLWERDRKWTRLASKSFLPSEFLDSRQRSSHKRRECFLAIQRRPRSILRVGPRFEPGCDFGDFTKFLARIGIVVGPPPAVDDKDSTATSRRASNGESGPGALRRISGGFGCDEVDDCEQLPELDEDFDATSPNRPDMHSQSQLKELAEQIPELDELLMKEFRLLVSKVEDLFWMDKEEKLECGDDVMSYFRRFATRAKIQSVDSGLLEALCQTSLPRMAEDLLDDWIVGDN